MTSPRNNEIQQALISILKADTDLSAELVACDSSITEIREDQWQGDQFIYPNVRVRMIDNVPEGDSELCNKCSFSVSIMVHSENASSLEADKIAGIINTFVSGKTFNKAGVQVYLRTTGIIPAVRSDTHTWRAECMMQGTAGK